jgi:hypothetical protein
MPAGFRDRLTYANVVATLALFIALGGTGYAAATVTSKDIKNRTIRGADVKRNTLTGTQIRESRLRRVPRARVADTAGSAATATRAGVATTANTATLAGLATNAQSLAGQGVGAFERTSTVQFSRAPVDPAGPSNQRALLSWPEAGIQVRSVAQGGCGGLQIQVANTRSSGAAIEPFVNGGSQGTVAPGASSNLCDQQSLDLEVSDASGRTLFVDCLTSNGEVRCLGVRSEP